MIANFNIKHTISISFDKGGTKSRWYFQKEIKRKKYYFFGKEIIIEKEGYKKHYTDTPITFERVLEEDNSIYYNQNHTCTSGVFLNKPSITIETTSRYGNRLEFYYNSIEELREEYFEILKKHNDKFLIFGEDEIIERD